VAAAKAGSMFGKYQLNRLLGQGGMGEVYEAHDTGKDRTVALKILPEELSRDEGFRARFQRESRAAAMLEEPHVIPIHDWGEIDGKLYIDMRLVRGQDLHECLRSGPLEPERAVGIIRQIAAALDAAHAQGLIHRDVKPPNILITATEDFAYLIDFGIAENRGDTRLTVAGSAVGSFAYMAPERFEDRPTTPAVDTYSLAAVLYETLTGQPPFKASSMEQVIAAHMSTPPPRPSAVNPQVPAAFDDVIARGLAKDPDDRYGSPGALGRAVQRALGATPTTGPNTAPTNATQAAPVYRPATDPSGPTLAAWQMANHPAPIPQQSATSPARPWLVPAVIIAAAALILAGIGVVIGLLARQNSAPPTSASPSTGYTLPAPVASPPPTYHPEAPPSPPYPPSPALPPAISGPDNSASHAFCDNGFSLTNMTGFGTHAQRGSDGTSCFFARSLLISYWNRYGNATREQRSVSSPGAVDCSTVDGNVLCDGSNFVIQCVAEGSDNWITCRGGNDAIVYLY
jgi:serine/threonine protein kinase